MTKKPNPRKFTDIGAFIVAMIAYYTSQLPAVDRFDSYDEAKAKQAAINDASDIAIEKAWDDWSDFIEACEDEYESGVGSSWDY